MTQAQNEVEPDVEAETADDGDNGAAVELPGPDVDGPADDEAGDEADAEDDADDEQGDGELGDEQARQEQARTERDLEKLHTQIGNANKAHAAKIARIMGDDAQALIPCPVCTDFVAGAIFPPEVAPLPDNVKERMKQLLGLDAWEDTPSAAWARQCDDCKGHGEVKTGSFVLGKETTRCLTCKGEGWQNLKSPEGVPVGLTEVPTETGPTVYGLDVSNDPDVQYLREKGYTVIPPMQVTGT